MAGRYIPIPVFVAQNKNTLVIIKNISPATVQGSLSHSLRIKISHMVHQCSLVLINSGLCNMKCLGVLLLFLDGI